MRRFGVILVAAAFLAAACGDDGPARDEQGSIADTGAASVFSFRTGDCFDDPSGEQTEVAELRAVPCTEPHDNEIFYTFDLPDGDFPGQDSMVSSASDACLGEVFVSYVGISYDQSALEVFPVTPTETSWAAGDRTVYCALYNLDLSKLTGSARGTER